MRQRFTATNDERHKVEWNSLTRNEHNPLTTTHRKERYTVNRTINANDLANTMRVIEKRIMAAGQLITRVSLSIDESNESDADAMYAAFVMLSNAQTIVASIASDTSPVTFWRGRCRSTRKTATMNNQPENPRPQWAIGKLGEAKRMRKLTEQWASFYATCGQKINDGLDANSEYLITVDDPSNYGAHIVTYRRWGNEVDALLAFVRRTYPGKAVYTVRVV